MKLVYINYLSLRIAVIILLIFSILPETGQLLKLPNLFQHYSEHKQSEKQDSFDFLSFLIEHYSDKSNDKEHSDLPFKQSCSSSNVLMVFERVFDFKIEPAFTFQTKTHFFTVNEVLHLSPAFSIWQPPKI